MNERNGPNALSSLTNCGVCGQPLVYATESVLSVCSFCGREAHTLIYCPAGHYICDACHSKEALDILNQVLATTGSANPSVVAEQVMAHPSVPMHGPEHHSIVPGAIVTAVRNAGYPVKEGCIEKTLERARKVPGGWCGFYGDCGAAVGVGIAVSVLTGATPLTGKERSLAMAATSFTLSRLLDDQPRCCKRATRVAVAAAVDFLRDHLGIILPRAEKVRCIYVPLNPQCAREKCPFYDDPLKQS